jgi:hypothetical protein
MLNPPGPPFRKGETSLARHFFQLPPFAKGDGGGFSCAGATSIRVMSVYDSKCRRFALVCQRESQSLLLWVFVFCRCGSVMAGRVRVTISNSSLLPNQENAKYRLTK